MCNLFHLEMITSHQCLEKYIAIKDYYKLMISIKIKIQIVNFYYHQRILCNLIILLNLSKHSTLTRNFTQMLVQCVIKHFCLTIDITLLMYMIQILIWCSASLILHKTIQIFLRLKNVMEVCNTSFHKIAINKDSHSILLIQFLNNKNYFQELNLSLYSNHQDQTLKLII